MQTLCKQETATLLINPAILKNSPASTKFLNALLIANNFSPLEKNFKAGWETATTEKYQNPQQIENLLTNHLLINTETLILMSELYQAGIQSMEESHAPAVKVISNSQQHDFEFVSGLNTQDILRHMRRFQPLLIEQVKD